MQAEDDVVKAWLVDHSGPMARLIGTYNANDKIQDVHISRSGQWAVTLDELANYGRHGRHGHHGR
jgi:hypothetical protein